MMPTASFSMHFPPGLIVFSSNTPASHVAMHGPFGELIMQPNASSFDDTGRKYSWAFSYNGSIQENYKFIFTATDREIVGEVIGPEIRVVSSSIRNGSGQGVTLAVPKPTYVPLLRGERNVPVAKRPVAARSAKDTKKAPLRAITPKVSVVTCTYNRPLLLRGAIDSLRRQTDPNWEHLIFDNGSTEEEVKDVLAYAEEDPRVRVFHGGGNQDQPAAVWNYLFDRARGKYFSVLDDDNEKLPQFVEVLGKELDENLELDLVTCGWLVVDPDGIVDGEQHRNLLTSEEELLRHSTCDGGAMLYRRETFERVGYFSEAIRTNEDWDWMRRGASFLTIKNLSDCFATYRSHKQNRMHRMHELGHDADSLFVRSRGAEQKLQVRFVRPHPDRLTRSQKDAIGSMGRSLGAISWVEEGNDLAVVVAPFQIPDRDLENAVRGCKRAVSVHIEDPYALQANLDRLRAVQRVCPELWVVTNDAGTVGHYEAVVGARIMVCPSLGADTDRIVSTPKERDIDVLLCGYAYPSRKKFVEELLPHLQEFRVLLVGDGWEEVSGENVSTMPTQDLDVTYQLHARARAVVCTHRTGGDCSDGPMPPQTTNRGFMEGAGGARVFVDRRRPKRSLDDGEVVWYDGVSDLVKELRSCLASSADFYASRWEEKCKMLLSYQTRMKRILNCIRAPRFRAEIP